MTDFGGGVPRGVLDDDDRASGERSGLRHLLHDLRRAYELGVGRIAEEQGERAASPGQAALCEPLDDAASGCFAQ